MRRRRQQKRAPRNAARPSRLQKLPRLRAVDRSKPHLLPSENPAATARLRCSEIKSPLGNRSLGDLGASVRVTGPAAFAESVLVYPLAPGTTVGLDPESIRFFRVDERGREVVPVWNSGHNVGLAFLWARITRPGVYVAIGLPRDQLLREAVRTIALERRLRQSQAPGKERSLQPLLELLDLPDEVIGELRQTFTRVEVRASVGGFQPRELELDNGGHPRWFALPGRASLADLRKKIRRLDPGDALPEEELFFPPVVPRNGEPPWNRRPDGPWSGADHLEIDLLSIWRRLRPEIILRLLPPWIFDSDWWMYQHDVQHSGHASGLCDIRTSTVGGMYLFKAVAIDGPAISKPVIVDGKIYVGSGKQGGSGGTLYKIDLTTGTVEHTLGTSGTAYYSWVSGIGGSPAVVDNRVYFTGVHGTVYCIDKDTFEPIWSVSLKTADLAHRQPVNNPNADCWSGPLVVNGRVYVGCGEGESPTTYGFVFCLDAATGDVVWCFCTCRFTTAAHNQPNHIPTAVAASWAGTNGFTVLANPPETGCCVWSSCAYDCVNDAIYVGTGNSQYPHTAQPDEFYGSGLISLNATTGTFRGFFQPSADDSYWPGDSDIDVPGSPSVYTLGAQRVVAFGSKNGSFFVLDAGTLAVVARRQLLPRTGGTGLPGDRGTGINAVVPNGATHTGENSYGIFGTPAIHYGLGRLFVGLGGYNGMALDAAAGIDQTRTPFLRAVNWGDLHDAWPTAVGADNVIRYTTAQPPMYSSLEVGLSSPAVTNDVVFVSTSPPPFSGDPARLYALSVSDGHCLWAAPGITTGPFALGPSIYGNYVVLGAGDKVYIFRLGPLWRFPPPVLWRRPWPWEIVRPPIRILPDVPRGPLPGPDPGPMERYG